MAMSIEAVRHRFLVAEEAATLRLADTWAAARLDIEARLAQAVADGASASDLAYYRALERDVAGVTTGAIGASRPWIDTTLATAYVEGALTHQAGFAFSLVDDRAVRAASTYTAGLITQVGLEMQNAVHAKIMLGVAGAWDAARLRSEIMATGLQRGPWRSVEQRAAVIARTETMRMYNTGALQAIKATGATEVKWIASPDERTCPICAPRHGQIFSVGTVDCPAHPRCRCTIRAHYDYGVRRPTPPPGGATSTESYEPPVNRAHLDAVMAQNRQRLNQLAIMEKSTPDDVVAKAMAHVRARLDATPLVVNRGARGAMGIVREGRFKTQFETQTSGGLMSNEGRTRAERGLFGYADDLPVEQRPVYGSMGGTSMYGDVEFILKDSVRSRTTFLVDDSLGHGWKLEADGVSPLAPSRLADPHPASIDWNRLPTEYDDPRLWARGSYTEIQVHGGVTLDDVASIDWGGTVVPDDILEALRARGITSTGQAQATTRVLAQADVDDAANRFLDALEAGDTTPDGIEDLMTYLTPEGSEGARMALEIWRGR